MISKCVLTASAAIVQLKHGNRSAMHRIIIATPDSLRPGVQITVASELVKAGDLDSATELLNEARQRMFQSGGAEMISEYFSLMRQYSMLTPMDALMVFNEIVKVLNRSEKSDPKAAGDNFEANESLLANDLLLGAYKVPSSLLDADELGVRTAISSIESPSKRVAIRLNLLSSSLVQVRNAPSSKPVFSQAKQKAN